eukprot:6400743-Prymnesium_polylepis.1
MLREARLRRERLRFDGAVFDSAPSRRIMPIAAPIVVSASGGGLREIARYVPYGIAAQLAAPALGVARPLGAFQELRDPTINIPRPELFVCSDGDTLVPRASIEDFARHRAELSTQSVS